MPSFKLTNSDMDYLEVVVDQVGAVIINIFEDLEAVGVV
jgi:hypothetical protein